MWTVQETAALALASLAQYVIAVNLALSSIKEFAILNALLPTNSSILQHYNVKAVILRAKHAQAQLQVLVQAVNLGILCLEVVCVQQRLTRILIMFAKAVILHAYPVMVLCPMIVPLVDQVMW